VVLARVLFARVLVALGQLALGERPQAADLRRELEPRRRELVERQALLVAAAERDDEVGAIEPRTVLRAGAVGVGVRRVRHELHDLGVLAATAPTRSAANPVVATTVGPDDPDEASPPHEASTAPARSRAVTAGRSAWSAR
jgi:hypothetical protein